MSIMQEKFKAIADKIREKLSITDLIKPNDFVNKIDDVYDAAKEAYGLKHTVIGNPITTSYISPNMQEIKIKTSKPNTVVKKYGKNLISYPYHETTLTRNGITFTDNGDGTITVNGTTSKETTFYLNYPMNLRINKDIAVVLSGCPRNNSEYYVNLRIKKTDGTNVWYNSHKTDVVVTGIDGVIEFAYITVKSDKTVNNQVFKPQLEVGYFSTDYAIGGDPVEYVSDSEGNINGIFTTGEKITLISEEDTNIECEYYKDKSAESDELWDFIQNGGTLDHYGSRFARWWTEYIRPKYKVVPTHEQGAQQIFASCKYLKKIEKEYFDLSQKPQNLTSTNSNFGYYYTFASCENLEEIEDIGIIPQNNYYYSFQYCYKLHTIAKMGVDENTKFTSTFIRCDTLENLGIYGTIGQDKFDIHWSTKLSAQSLYNIITCLSITATGLTVTLPTTAEANYNANPPEGAPSTWAELIATRSNWTIAYA